MSSLTISIIQTDLIWENKAANLENLERKILSIEEKTELIILPEMFNTGFSMNPEALAEEADGPCFQWMKRMSQLKRVALTGSFMVHVDGSYYNRLIWMLPNGDFGYYDKRHLFAFAGEDQHFSAGNQKLMPSIKGWRINLLICYDLRFPVWSRQVQSSPYDLLIYVANWPERRSNAWKSLLMARAIENQSFVIGVNRVGTDGLGNYHTGDSSIIDPLGEILFHQANEESIHTITIHKSHVDQIREKLPFLKDADDFHIIP